MARSILEVRGIGPVTIELLAGQVINDAKALFAEVEPEALKVKKKNKLPSDHLHRGRNHQCGLNPS